MLPHHDEIARLEARVAELEGALQNGRCVVLQFTFELANGPLGVPYDWRL